MTREENRDNSRENGFGDTKGTSTGWFLYFSNSFCSGRKLNFYCCAILSFLCQHQERLVVLLQFISLVPFTSGSVASLPLAQKVRGDTSWKWRIKQASQVRGTVIFWLVDQWVHQTAFTGTEQMNCATRWREGCPVFYSVRMKSCNTLRETIILLKFILPWISLENPSKSKALCKTS
jgi:hypothetical protein